VVRTLTEEVGKAGERARETQETVHSLVVAVGEYGKHLMSHTDVLRGLAATTAELQRAASNLSSALRSTTKAGDVPPATGSPPSGPPVERTTAVPTKPTMASPRQPLSLHAERESRLATEIPCSEPPERQSAAPVLQEIPKSVRSPRREQTMTDPAWLRQPTLKHSFRGYSCDAVERLLAQVADALEQTEKERDELRRHLRSAEEELAHYRGLEASLSQALTAADQHANDLKEHSARQAELVVAKVRETLNEQAPEHERLLADAHKVSAQLEEVLGALKRRAPSPEKGLDQTAPLT
jgi:cell division initiation protein